MRAGPSLLLLLDEAGAARAVTATVRDFRAAVKAGALPPGRAIPGLGLRWHRAELEAVTARLYGLDRLADAQQDGRETARAALDAYQPPTKARRAPALRPGPAGA
jgi:hypothetical protein